MDSYASFNFRPRPQHNSFTDCQTVCYEGSETIGAATASFVANSTSPFGGDCRTEIAKLVDEYFSANPDGTVIFGNYAPRGKKRRGLRTKQRRLFCVKLGNERHYFPGAVYRRGDMTVTRERVTVRCHCRRVNRSQVPLNTVLWSMAS